MPLQVIMAVLIFALLGSISPDDGRTRADEVRNGLFSTIAFVLGAATSILSGYVGMKIATYANARTALEARKGIAPAFMCGGLRWCRRSRRHPFRKARKCFLYTVLDCLIQLHHALCSCSPVLAAPCCGCWQLGL
jgi:hypothetical protein